MNKRTIRIAHRKPHLHFRDGQWRASFSNYQASANGTARAFERLQSFVYRATSGRVQL